MNGMTRRAALALSRCLGRPVVVVNRWDRFDVALPDGGTMFGESLVEVNGELDSAGHVSFRLVLLSGAHSDELVTEPVAEGTEVTDNLEGTDSANPDSENDALHRLEVAPSGKVFPTRGERRTEELWQHDLQFSTTSS